MKLNNSVTSNKNLMRTLTGFDSAVFGERFRAVRVEGSQI